MDAAVYPTVEKVRLIKKIRISTLVWGILLLSLCIFIKIFSYFPFAIEQYYSRGIYPYISSFYRFIFGWIPFSFGDLFYFATGSYLLYLFIRIIVLACYRRLTRVKILSKLKSIGFTIAAIYIYFNLSWGLNYNRPGIASQLNLTPQMHNAQDLKTITAILLQKLNDSRLKVNNDKIAFKPYPEVFGEAQQAFQAASVNLPFMNFKTASVKRSMYGRMGNYLGFLGYYNPFTGEAQLNLTMPRFLIPYVVCHEMAHQLGYASESEASFVGYLAAVNSKDILFQYSTYFDFFEYANRELYYRDSAAAKSNYKQLNSLVKNDMTEVRSYWKKSENSLEPIIKVFYDHYLKANQQVNGLKSYNEVIGWLIAYYKKYGKV